MIYPPNPILFMKALTLCRRGEVLVQRLRHGLHVKDEVYRYPSSFLKNGYKDLIPLQSGAVREPVGESA